MTDPCPCPEADADLATVLQQFTNLIMNERVRAYNEGLDAGRQTAEAKLLAELKRLHEQCGHQRTADLIAEIEAPRSPAQTSSE